MDLSQRAELNRVISKNLSALLVEKQISPGRLAKAVGASRSCIRSLAEGKSNSSAILIGRICKTLEISVSDLVYDRTEE